MYKGEFEFKTILLKNIQDLHKTHIDDVIWLAYAVCGSGASKKKLYSHVLGSDFIKYDDFCKIISF